MSHNLYCVSSYFTELNFAFLPSSIGGGGRYNEALVKYWVLDPSKIAYFKPLFETTAWNIYLITTKIK